MNIIRRYLVDVVIDHLNEGGAMKIKCRLMPHSISAHLQQIYTGFSMLRRAGLVELSQSIVKKPLETLQAKSVHFRNADHAHLDVVLNDSIRLHFDTHDSWEIDEEYLKDADFYFKRSFSAQDMASSERYSNVFPLGLNYKVFPSFFDANAIKRSLVLAKGVSGKKSALYFLNKSKFIPDVNNMWAPPDFGMEPKILLMLRIRDPLADPERPKEKIEERREINDVRAASLRALKKEFGSNFFGGINHTEYAKKYYRDLLLEDPNSSSQKTYINTLRSYPICVATTGLHGSIGWKFAEYVAFSKAIISERLNYEVPGNLSKNINYLEFSGPDQCVEEAVRLFTNASLRKAIMKNNFEYYHSYLRPDLLVMNAIVLALSA